MLALPAPTPIYVFVAILDVIILLPDIVTVPLTVRFPAAVNVPVEFIVVAVMEPLMSTTKLPLATDIVPVVLMLMFDARSAPVIEPSMIVALLTEFVLDDDVIPVNAEPLPEK